MKYIIKSAKTFEEAKKEALSELKLEEHEVEIEVLEEASKGLFGLIGARDAKIKVTEIRNIEKLSKEFLEKVINSMDLKASIDIKREDNNLFVDIQGINPDDKGIIIGKRGNTLDALQYILSLFVNKEEGEYIKVILDVEGYRQKREITLVRLAQRMADKAISSKIQVKLEPMNPYERRIIHSTLQENKDIKTFSEGNDPYRRVVIQAK
ncbi:RNA-binding cell elongation regulator Jag/EloR [Tissierella creatinophila]|uniref:RNA-binding protein KhpB n=1 Tax=Tissierella creatinophila DSM 6911 TaxID=1123403 RepID=A0A1U7M5W1_TISCR|nr:RNA-binding cell elongation regulator Jag/EloR [Tissierella creatinophila]OLS02714.1 R3H domain protein [Tissierella creatinophila DSM 6911]